MSTDKIPEIGLEVRRPIYFLKIVTQIFPKLWVFNTDIISTWSLSRYHIGCNFNDLIQESIVKENESMFYRELEEERLRKEMQLAKFQYKINNLNWSTLASNMLSQDFIFRIFNLYWVIIFFVIFSCNGNLLRALNLRRKINIFCITITEEKLYEGLVNVLWLRSLST